MLTRTYRRQIAEVSRPPRPLWRVVGTLPLLTLAVLLLMRTTFAWFADGTFDTGSAFASGTFTTLMVLSSDQVAFDGYIGDAYSGSFTVTSTATVPLPIRVIYQGSGGGPDVLTISNSLIQPGETLTVSISGTYSSNFDGDAVLIIGSADYDQGAHRVQLTARARELDNLIVVSQIASAFLGSAGDPQISNELFALVTSPTPVQVNAAVSQTPLASASPSGPSDIYPVIVDPISFTATATAQELRFNIARLAPGKPICVSVTFSSPDTWVTGEKIIYFVVAHQGDKNSLPACGP